MEYRVISKGVDNRRFIPLTEDMHQRITDYNHDYYKSIFIYNEAHKKQHDETKSVAGIKDVTTDLLLWDFDSKDNIHLAQKDAMILVDRLTKENIDYDSIGIYFSGNKGFHVEVKTDKRFTPAEFKSITYNMASDLNTYDTAINDANRLIRLEKTKHQTTGLYKIPMSYEGLIDFSVDEIKDLAKTDNFLYLTIKPTILPDSIYLLKDKIKNPATPKVTNPIDVSELDFTKKLKGLTNCRHAIFNGFYTSGQRSNLLMALSASLKNLNTPEDHCYSLLKSADRARVNREGGDRFDKKEVWNIVKSVYSPQWNGGTYTCREPGLLQDYCHSLGTNKCKQEKDELPYVEVGDVFGHFKNFAKNIDNNTIRLGLPLIDQKLRITTSSLNMILGCPGAGKTSALLNILNSTSNDNIPSIFYSMDMSSPLLVQKIIQRATGYDGSKIYDLFQREDKQKIDEIYGIIEQEYKNVKFDFRSGQTVSDIRENIIRYQDKIGSKVKMVAIDYAESIAGPFSDSVANTQIISNQLRDMSNELELSTILVVQPQKSAGTISDPLLSMRKIKGSSSLEQNASVIFSLYREGFDPKNPDTDKYLSISVLKNRMGSHFTEDFFWNGIRGTISPIDDEGRVDLESIRRKKKVEEVKSSGGLWD